MDSINSTIEMTDLTNFCEDNNMSLLSRTRPLHYKATTYEFPNQCDNRRRRKCLRRWQVIPNEAVLISILILTIVQNSILYTYSQTYPQPSPVRTPSTPVWRQSSGGDSASSPLTTTVVPSNNVSSTEAPSSSAMPNATEFPSSSPTGTPANATLAPSTDWSYSTTQAVTAIPTGAPIASTTTPTDSATVQKTESPTAAPVAKPVQTPVNKPTHRPTPSPTRKPVPSPTKEPTYEPTIKPTLKYQKTVVKVIMRLTNTKGKLSDEAEFDFTAATSAHIKQNTKELNEAGITVKTVETSIDNQRLAVRRLQTSQQLTPLQITFNVLITFQSKISSFDVAEWIKEAFNSYIDRASFIDRLQQLNVEFSDVVKIDVQVNGEITDDNNNQNENPIVTPDNQNSSSNTKLWIIVGASAGGFIILLALVLILVKKRKRNEDDRKKSQKLSDGRTSVEEASKGMGYAAEINVDRQDDISTLGDPVYGGPIGGMIIDDMEQRDEYTASVGPDYDYSRLLGASRSDSMGTTTLNNEINSHDQSVRASEGTSGSKNLQQIGTGPFHDDDDDISFEEQYASNTRRSDSQDRFEVEVPPGKLGMVIDTPNNGVPVVHAIKQESVLCDRVHVGDRLISVDGENVTSMTAVQVSKLISLKSDQRRVLVFLRAKDVNTSNSDDDLDP